MEGWSCVFSYSSLRQEMLIPAAHNGFGWKSLEKEATVFPRLRNSTLTEFLIIIVINSWMCTQDIPAVEATRETQCLALQWQSESKSIQTRRGKQHTEQENQHVDLGWCRHPD